MKIAIIAPYRTVAPHFETELEIAQQHIDAGDEVQFLSCEGELANCDFNIDRDPSICGDCRGRREHGMDLLGRKCKTYQIQAVTEVSIPQFDSLEQLMDWEVDNFDVGYAALSSLISLVRDPDPDLSKHTPLLNRFIESALTVWRQTQDFIDQNRPDRIYVFNGRFAAMRAVFRACQNKGVDCFMHERGCDTNHYDLIRNRLPHDIDGIDANIRMLWAEADVETRGAIGASWFEDRVDRVERSWVSFTKEQKAGLLPEGFDSAARNVAIFCSSEDEFVAIGGAWRNDLYSSQVEAIASIAESMLKSAPETRLYLRVHPNLKDVDNARKRSMMALEFPNLTIVAADASIDTYALMKASDATLTFGSSVGMEAVFWGRPSVVFGPSLYQHLSGPIRSHSIEQTVELLAGDLQPSDDRTGALMYGHWLQARGIRYKYFEAADLFEGKFKGQVVHDREMAKLVAKKRRSLMSLFG